jgi:hypothetical protein
MIKHIVNIVCFQSLSKTYAKFPPTKFLNNNNGVLSLLFFFFFGSKIYISNYTSNNIFLRNKPKLHKDKILIKQKKLSYQSNCKQSMKSDSLFINPTNQKHIPAENCNSKFNKTPKRPVKTAA